MSLTNKRKHQTQYIVLALAFLYVWVPRVVYAAPPPSSDVCNNAGAACNHFVTTYINPIILLLTGLVGIIAVISIIVAGIQYSASADDPGAVTKAKQRIFNTILGLLAYLFLFGFLNYLIPGGIL